MSRAVQHLRANAIAYLALFIALSGSGYAAISIPRGAVGTAQLRNHAITPVKLSGKYFNGEVRAWAVVRAGGQLLGGAGKPRSATTSYPGHYTIDWGVKLSRTCATIANVDGRSQPTETVPVSGTASQPEVAGYVSAVESQTFHGTNFTDVTTFNQAGRVTPLAFDLVVIC